MYLLLMLTCIAYFRFCSSNYEYICPTSLNWHIRSIALCTISEKYSCLRDANKDTSKETCRGTPSMLAPGNKYVIRGNLDGEDCDRNRYQPFIFKTNKNNECAVKKSTCNEAGQIMYGNGSTIEDNSCRCDYSKSYAPINKPSKPCYCMPSQEDCSCYLKRCPEKTHLSSVYTCVSDFTLMTLDSCGPISLSRSDASTMKRVIKRNENIDRVKTKRFDELLLVALMAVLSGFILVAIPCIIAHDSISFNPSFQNAPVSNSSDLYKTSLKNNVENGGSSPEDITEGEDINDSVIKKIVNQLQERTQSANEKEKGFGNIAIVLVSSLQTATDKRKANNAEKNKKYGASLSLQLLEDRSKVETNIDEKENKYGSSSSLQLLDGRSKVDSDTVTKSKQYGSFSNSLSYKDEKKVKSHTDGKETLYGSVSNLNYISDEAIDKSFQAYVKLYMDIKEEHNSNTGKEEGNTAGKIRQYLSGSNISAHNNENINDTDKAIIIQLLEQLDKVNSENERKKGDDEAKSAESITYTRKDQFVKPIADDKFMADDEEDQSDLNTSGDDEAKSVESITDTREEDQFVKPIADDESMADDEEDQSDLNTSVISQTFDYVKRFTNNVAQTIMSPLRILGWMKQDVEEKSNEFDSITKRTLKCH